MSRATRRDSSLVRWSPRPGVQAPEGGAVRADLDGRAHARGCGREAGAEQICRWTVAHRLPTPSRRGAARWSAPGFRGHPRCRFDRECRDGRRLPPAGPASPLQFDARIRVRFLLSNQCAPRSREVQRFSFSLEVSMMRFTRCQLGLAVALSALTLSVQAQQPANAAPSGTSAQGSNAQAAHADNAHATRKHAMAHHAKRHGSQASANAEASGSDSAYKAALRQCVTGPAAQRDSCLDQAISRYARA